ncbi:MAG: LLM class flavin-dependent oxidoreductase [Microlunatus sp.]
MRYGAHLPLIDFDGHGWQLSTLTAYARTAAGLGYAALAANDHLVFRRPWLDGIVALAGVVGASGDLELATTATLPVIRGAGAVASAASALDTLSGGRLRLGVAPGSSPADFELVGVPFDQRWARFDEAVTALRRERPERPLCVASWGSAAGLRRVARLGDGWLASAYNTSPEQVARGLQTLGEERDRLRGPARGFPCTVATMWTHITDSRAERESTLDLLASTLGRPREALVDRVLVGASEQCARLVRGYADVGVDLLCLWPVVEPERQLERFMTEVAPLVQPEAG